MVKWDLEIQLPLPFIITSLCCHRNHSSLENFFEYTVGLQFRKKARSLVPSPRTYILVEDIWSPQYPLMCAQNMCKWTFLLKMSFHTGMPSFNSINKIVWKESLFNKRSTVLLQILAISWTFPTWKIERIHGCEWQARIPRDVNSELHICPWLVVRYCSSSGGEVRTRRKALEGGGYWEEPGMS